METTSIKGRVLSFVNEALVVVKTIMGEGVVDVGEFNVALQIGDEIEADVVSYYISNGHIITVLDGLVVGVHPIGENRHLYIIDGNKEVKCDWCANRIYGEALSDILAPGEAFCSTECISAFLVDAEEGEKYEFNLRDEI